MPARRAFLGAFSFTAVVALAMPLAIAQDRPEFVIAVLGDSYASGEGAPDIHGHYSLGGDIVAPECAPGSPYGPCFSATWWSPDSWFSHRLAVFPQQDDPGWQDDARRCHRSSKGPGAHAAMLIAASFPDVKITVLDFACGGSQITDGLLFGWPGPEPALGAPNLPSQVDALEAYASSTHRHIDAIVMNIGGNDALFADIIIDCVISSWPTDCANDPLFLKVGALLKDDTTPAFPDPNATLRARYSVLDAVFRNAAGDSAGIHGLVAGRPDEVYLTGPPNASHAAPPPADLSANPDNFCDGTQTTDRTLILPGYLPGYDNVSRGESEAMQDVIGGAQNSMRSAMKIAAKLHGWVFVDMFAITRDHGVCANASSFFRTNQDALRIQGDKGLISSVVGTGVAMISPGIAHQNENGYAARAGLIANSVGEQVRMRFSAPTLMLDQVETGTASKVTFEWNDPSPLGPPETRWELELTPPGRASAIHVISDGPDAGELTEEPIAGGRTLDWRVSESGEFAARVRGCRTTPTGFYCGPFSNAVNVVTFVPDTPVELRGQQTANGLQLVQWKPGPRTPNSVRYEVAFGPYGTIPCSTRFTRCGGSGIVNTTIMSTTSTTIMREPSQSSSADAFLVRSCSTAGCSAYTSQLVLENIEMPVSPTVPTLPQPPPPSVGRPLPQP